MCVAVQRNLTFDQEAACICTPVDVFPPLCPCFCDLAPSLQLQTIKTAIDSAKMLLRIDDIVSGISKKKDGPSKAQPSAEVEDHDNVDSERMLQE